MDAPGFGPASGVWSEGDAGRMFNTASNLLSGSFVLAVSKGIDRCSPPLPAPGHAPG